MRQIKSSIELLEDSIQMFPTQGACSECVTKCGRNIEQVGTFQKPVHIKYVTLINYKYSPQDYTLHVTDFWKIFNFSGFLKILPHIYYYPQMI